MAYSQSTREDLWPVSTTPTIRLFGCKQEVEKTSFFSKAVKQLTDNKSAGPYSIPAEALKTDIETSVDVL